MFMDSSGINLNGTNLEMACLCSTVPGDFTKSQMTDSDSNRRDQKHLEDSSIISSTCSRMNQRLAIRTPSGGLFIWLPHILKGTFPHQRVRILEKPSWTWTQQWKLRVEDGRITEWPGPPVCVLGQFDASLQQLVVVYCSVAKSCPTLCDRMNCTRLPYPSPSPGACSNSCPLSQ